jgi:hypothetical protein
MQEHRRSRCPGDRSRAQILADDWALASRSDVIAQFNYLPTIRAQIALTHRNSAPSKY